MSRAFVWYRRTSFDGTCSPAGSGRIVNIGSRAGKVGLRNYSHYSASKFALEGLMAALAEGVKDKGIEVDTVSLVCACLH